MEKVELSRFQTQGILGTGADYEVRSALDQETGKQVVLKRPMPQMISRRLHGSTEARTERMLQFFQEFGDAICGVVPPIGYTDPGNHDEFYGDSLGQEYRVIVEERAAGIPLLVGDMMARITGVPIGVGQNLFALFPISQPEGQCRFPVHQQLMDTEESFFNAGYVLLDLRPQNLFYQPASGRITIVDCADLVSANGETKPGSRTPRDIHDFYLELLKFYTTPKSPPEQAADYREPYGLRPVVRFEQELDEMADGFREASGPGEDAMLHLISRVRERGYSDFERFRQDLNAYLEAVSARNQSLSDSGQARQAWSEALGWLKGDHWQRYIFDPEAELAAFDL